LFGAAINYRKQNARGVLFLEMLAPLALVTNASEGVCHRVPGMGDNLVVKVHYRLGSRNC